MATNQGVATPHVTYANMFHVWEKIRDCVAGEDRLKELAHDRHYLPNFFGAEPEAMQHYTGYRDRASYYNASGRTVSALFGAIFRRPPILTLPNTTDEQMVGEGVTLSGDSLDSFVARVVREVLITGRYGILTDFDSVTEKPYLAGYCAEDIVNWSVDDRGKLWRVVLREHYCAVGENEFTEETRARYRVLELRDGVYIQRLFMPDKDGAYGEGGEEHQPLKAGEQINHLPFVFVGPTDTAPDIDQPPLADLANVNISHFKNSADLEHGLHFCALPTPVIYTGVTKSVWRIGAEVWELRPGDSAEMLEFSGSGLAALSARIVTKEEQMANLGARMLTGQKKAAETAEALRIRHGSESATLAAMAGVISHAITVALREMLSWTRDLAEKDSVQYQLNDDFVDVRMSADEAVQLMQLYQGGAISQHTLLYNYQRGEMYEQGWTTEQEIANIESVSPDLPPA